MIARLIFCVLGATSTLLNRGSHAVTLKNGKTFDVETRDGMPLGVTTPQVKIQGASVLVGSPGDLAPTDSSDHEPGPTAHLYFLYGGVKVSGHFNVRVSSPMDDSIQGRFSVSGPGGFAYEGLSRTRVPAAWAWLNEPGDSWIPILLHFQSDDSKIEFDVLQWILQTEFSKNRIKAFEGH